MHRANIIKTNHPIDRRRHLRPELCFATLSRACLALRALLVPVAGGDVGDGDCNSGTVLGDAEGKISYAPRITSGLRHELGEAIVHRRLVKERKKAVALFWVYNIFFLVIDFCFYVGHTKHMDSATVM